VPGKQKVSSLKKKMKNIEKLLAKVTKRKRD
jgi:hypothetical protein